jgi:hypothetical protein
VGGPAPGRAQQGEACPPGRRAGVQDSGRVEQGVGVTDSQQGRGRRTRGWSRHTRHPRGYTPTRYELTGTIMRVSDSVRVLGSVNH